MKPERRWLKSAVAATAPKQVSMPWQHDSSTRPEAMQVVSDCRSAARKIFAMAAR